MRDIGGFQIKRAEKYFVFASMSRKERVLTEKMAPFATYAVLSFTADQIQAHYSLTLVLSHYVS